MTDIERIKTEIERRMNINLDEEERSEHSSEIWQAAATEDWDLLCFIDAMIQDKQVRKELIKHLKEGAEGYEPAGDSEDYKRWLAWVEKQKPADEMSSDKALQYLKENHSPSEMSDFQAAMNIAVAKAFDAGRKSVEKKPVEWSEEERKIIETLIRLVRDYNWKRITCGFAGADKDEVLSWLKCLSPQPHWKPNEEQMAALLTAIGDEKKHGSDVSKTLLELYTHLKTL